MSPPRELLCHLVEREAWQTAAAAGSYVPPSLASEGFIHLSTPQQVLATAARYYRGHPDLLVLLIDPQRLDGELRYESPPPTSTVADQRFPHYFAALPRDAVVEVLALPARADGLFDAPPQLAELL